jgi:iron(III) transport system ATP-binding protein
MIAVDNVTLRFGDVAALDDVSLAVQAGEIVALLGPSGSGKSTLLRVVAGLARPQTGTVRLAGATVTGAGLFVPPERRRVGMVFQDYSLFPHLTVAANIAFGLRPVRGADADPIVGALMERLGLSRYAASYPHMLSGGERQRVALARALAPRPQVLLMDEPFSGLDGRLRDRVREETLGLLRETSTTTVVVTHDPAEAMRIADRLALLHGGRLVQSGAAREVYARPATVFAARLLSEVNELAASCHGGRVETPLGTFAAPLVPDGAAVRVCVRPEHLRAARGGSGVRATVTAAEFLGDSTRVTCAVDGAGSPVALRTSVNQTLLPGDPVFLQADPSGVVVMADEESAQGSAS